MAHTVRSISPVDLAAMTDRAAQHGISYASAGVDIEAGDRAVELFKPLASKATRPEVRGGLGGFAGLFALRGGYREPVLASLDRRRRHQAGRGPGDGQARHRRPRPRRDGRRRPGGVRRRAAVPAGLHRRRAHGPRAGERARVGHRQRMRDRRVRAARRRDRRTSRADGARPLRHLRDGCGRRGGRRRPRTRPGQAGRRDHRHGLNRPALQRLFAGPQGPAGDRPDEPGRTRRGVRPDAGRGAARAHPHLRQGLSCAGVRIPGADVLPRHRWRAGGQSGARDPARAGWPRSIAGRGRRHRCSA